MPSGCRSGTWRRTLFATAESLSSASTAMRSPWSSPPTGIRAARVPLLILRGTLPGLDVIARAGNPLGSITSLSAVPGTDDVIVSGAAGGAGRLAVLDLETGRTEATTELRGARPLSTLL